MDTIFLDTETTGLTIYDEILEIAIVDYEGNILLDKLVRPTKNDHWMDAEKIHGISPEDVAGAPTINEIRDEIADIIKDKHLVIYNSKYDMTYLNELNISPGEVSCCMLWWSDKFGEWNEYYGNRTWQPLRTAAAAVRFEWPEKGPHRALSDALACRAVWMYMKDKNEKERVDNIIEEEKIDLFAKQIIHNMEHHDKQIYRLKSRYMDGFLKLWWLRKNRNKHWSSYTHEYETANTFCKIFFNKPIDFLELKERFGRNVYTYKKDIPFELRPASYFPRNRWFRELLKPSGAYCGPNSTWLLYDMSEIERIDKLHPLRLIPIPELNPGEELMTMSDLLKVGYKHKDIDKMTPVVERMNEYNCTWYYLYIARTKEHPNDRRQDKKRDP